MCVLFSGGKDSTYALWCATQQGWEVEFLLNMRPKNNQSWMFHHPAVEWTHLQAQALGLPLFTADISGEKERELVELEGLLADLKQKHKLDGLVSGALESEYQRTRLDLVCEAVGLRSFAPLWRKNPKRLVEEEIESGHEVIITSCNAMGLTEAWLGRVLNSDTLERLEALADKTGINLAFEGGEAETFVVDGPSFRRRIRLEKYERFWSGDSGYLKIVGARLEN